MSIRTRFAPSPTGGLHIGGVRTALFSYLYAKKHGGQFVLRIEDTDQTRFVEGAEDYINETLTWCGIPPDESPQIGGQHAPYRQSERKANGDYQKYAEQLVAQGDAYYAFDTPEDLATLRQQFEQEGKKFQYDAATRQLPNLKNSLTLSSQDVADRLLSNEPAVIRIKMPEHGQLSFTDLIRGNINFDAHLTDDKVLLKADGMPTYHLAVVVDDYMMEITHAFRGEEWLPSAPVHIQLYKCLGWIDKMPQFAHLPLILKPDGKGKLSKRDGDKLGFPVYALSWLNRDTNTPTMGFREQGFLPAAVLNFLALLGWHPDTEQEIFSLEQLIEHFDISRVNKAGAKFDYNKAKWFNEQYLRHTPNNDLATAALQIAPENLKNTSLAYLSQVFGLMKERLTFGKDIWTEGIYFFECPATYDAKTMQKKWKPELAPWFVQLNQLLLSESTTDVATLEALTKNAATEADIKIGDVMPLLRLALTGSMAGPGVFDMMAVMGIDEVVDRIGTMIAQQ